MENKNYFEVMIVGLGGQGALFIAQLLAESAMAKYEHITYLPNYGAQMRMGPCEATVTLSDKEIISPVTLTPQVVIMMGAAPLQIFEQRMAPGSTMIIDGSLVKIELKRKDLKALYIPATRTAIELGSQQIANLIMLGAYLELTKALPIETVEESIAARMAASIRGPRPELLALNKAALREGAKLITEQLMAEDNKVKEKVSAS